MLFPLSALHVLAYAHTGIGMTHSFFFVDLFGVSFANACTVITVITAGLWLNCCRSIAAAAAAPNRTVGDCDEWGKLLPGWVCLEFGELGQVWQFFIATYM